VSASAPYRDADADIDVRVSDLLGRMTRTEKIAQLGAVWPRDIASGGVFDSARSASAIPEGIGHITRIAASSVLGPQQLARLANDAQRWLIERTRLGIPAIIHEESCAGFTAKGATQFPQSIGLASTWEPDLIAEAAEVIREQMLAVGARQALAPVLDIVRDARWGRVEETFGEDPYLSGRMAVAYVRGIQSDDLANGVIATGKHFLGYGASEGGMNWAPAHLGRREILEVYARPFEAAIREAGLASMMNSYGEIDGDPAGGSSWLLTELLRGQLGFDGTIVSDYYTVVTLMAYHRVAATKAEAAARALNAGIDVELPRLDCFLHLGDALDAGLIEEAVIDGACARLLKHKFLLGLFERPYVDDGVAARVFDVPEHRKLARRIAHRSVVLLKNDEHLLPLADHRTIAVIGPASDSVRLLQGDYHYPTHLEISFGAIREPHDGSPQHEGETSEALLPTAERGDVDLSEHFVRHVTLLEGIRAAAPEGTRILHARGCGTSGNDTSGFADAIGVAREADVVVVCVGTRSGLVGDASSGEFSDRADLGLPGVQQALVDSVIDTGTPVVVVLVNGGVLAIPSLAERAPAIIEAWLPGEEGGNAVADVLFGAVNPAGRLPVSMPRSVGQVPVFHNHKPSGGRSNVRGHYVDSPATPLYPFGHGLSYTTFEYSNLGRSAAEVAPSGLIDVSVDVTNTGARAGDEVAQLYLHDVVGSMTRPVRQLAGFVRLRLEPGETRRVMFHVDVAQLAFYDETMRLIVEPGEVRVLVGASSEDIRQHASFTIIGERRILTRWDARPTEVEVR
jgi:beta-glucosidase